MNNDFIGSGKKGVKSVDMCMRVTEKSKVSVAGSTTINFDAK